MQPQLELGMAAPGSAPSLRLLKDEAFARIQHVGAPAMTMTELVSLVVDDPQTALLLAECYPTPAALARAGVVELQQFKGMGAKRAARLKAACELGRRATYAVEEKPQVKSPADGANLIMGEMSLLVQEEMWVLMLDTRNRLQGISRIYKGSLNTTVVRVGEIFRDAIRNNCAAVIVAHNHPSGDPSPSPEDVQVTTQIVNAGRLLDIDVLDHLVIGQARFVSLRERGLGFS